MHLVVTLKGLNNLVKPLECNVKPEVKIRIRRLKEGRGLPLPSYRTAGSAGMDLFAAADAALEPGGRRLVPTGIAVEIPEGFEGQVRPRSGLALKKGLSILNAPGTIDSDYRGPVGVILINLGRETVTVKRGERIAQLIVAPVTRARVEEVPGLSETERAGGGFGSTGQ